MRRGALGWIVPDALWEIAGPPLRTLTMALANRFGEVHIILEFSTTERCDHKCQTATGDDCSCSCRGEHHGGGTYWMNWQLVGEDTLIGPVVRVPAEARAARSPGPCAALTGRRRESRMPTVYQLAAQARRHAARISPKASWSPSPIPRFSATWVARVRVAGRSVFAGASGRVGSCEGLAHLTVGLGSPWDLGVFSPTRFGWRVRGSTASPGAPTS